MDERFERGRKAAESGVWGPSATGDEVLDVEYFFARAGPVERREKQRRTEYPHGRRMRVAGGDFTDRRRKD